MILPLFKRSKIMLNQHNPMDKKKHHERNYYVKEIECMFVEHPSFIKQFKINVRKLIAKFGPGRYQIAFELFVNYALSKIN